MGRHLVRAAGAGWRPWAADRSTLRTVNGYLSGIVLVAALVAAAALLGLLTFRLWRVVGPGQRRES